MPDLQTLLARSASRHSHLCPRQILGVRMGLTGAAALGMEVPRKDKRLLVIIETDGCFADGVEVVTGCSVGKRTLRVEDYGKVAATFVGIETGRAVRLTPQLDVRQRAKLYAHGQKRRYFAQLHGYQIMPIEELLTVQEVVLTTPVKTIISRPGVRTNCEACGEEIINQREVMRESMVLCCSCANPAYYRSKEDHLSTSVWKITQPQEVLA